VPLCATALVTQRIIFQKSRSRKMPTTNNQHRRADHETLDGVQMRQALRGQLMVGVGRLSDLLVDRIEEGIDLLLMHRARAGEVVGINEGKEVIGEQQVVGCVSPAPGVQRHDHCYHHLLRWSARWRSASLRSGEIPFEQQHQDEGRIHS